MTFGNFSQRSEDVWVWSNKTQLPTMSMLGQIAELVNNKQYYEALQLYQSFYSRSVVGVETLM